MHPRPGFVLPMALLLLALMTAGALAVLSLGTAEVRVLDNERAQTSAFAMAEAGLQAYLARGRITPDENTFVFPAGRARVRASLLRAAAGDGDPALYVIRSEGITPSTAAAPEGRRTVAQLAWLVPSRFRARAAWTSFSGLDKRGKAGMISGIDACDGDAVAGVRVPNGKFAGDTEPLFGNPKIEERTEAEMVAGAGIDWAGIRDPVAPSLTPDFVVCYPGDIGEVPGWASWCGSLPPSTTWNDPDYWPLIVLNGSPTLRSYGRGTLVVTGNLTFGAGGQWDGIVLVGGIIQDHGSGTISGTVISGLNSLLPGQPVTQYSSKHDDPSGAKNYTYDSCKVRHAAERHSRLVQIPNAWVDNWTAW